MEMTNTQQVKLTIVPKNKKGGAARLDGAPVWNVSDDTLLALDVAANGLSAIVMAQGPIGLATVSATGDADLGEGVKPISWSLEIDVVGGEAVASDFEIGTPEEQP